MLTGNPIAAKNADGVLRVISVGRLSQPKETAEATQRSLEAIRCENERLIKTLYDGELHIHYLGEQVSGMLAERQTMTELWNRVATGKWDLIVSEDLSRIFRNPSLQLKFLQDCVDARIRVICFADNLDTGDENWESAALFAAVRHGFTIPDTRRRIKRTATQSFKRGGMVMKVKAFYEKISKEDAASGKYGPKGLRLRKREEFSWAMNEIRQRLLAGQSARSVVTWLKSENIPCGQYVTSQRWTKRVLKGLLEDPILHGMRTFRNLIHQQVYRTGKYRRDKNPTPDREYVPELAFMSREEQEAMLAAVGWTIDWGGRQATKQANARTGISRYESYWPAQATTCGACGALLHCFGKHLRCSRSLGHLDGECWNHCQVPIAPLRSFIVKWLVTQCGVSAEFRSTLLEATKQQLNKQRGDRELERCTIDAKIKDLEGQERNLRQSIRVAEAIAEEDLEMIVKDLAIVTREIRELRNQAAATESSNPPVPCLDEENIISQLGPVLEHLLGTSFEMAEVIRGFVPYCVIVPVQSLDSGQVYPRAKLRVRANVADYDQLDELVVDLFEPPLLIRIMPEAVRLRSQQPQPSYKQIGKVLDVSYMTVKRALRYARLMQAHGMTTPFRELTAKPTRAARWRDAS